MKLKGKNSYTQLHTLFNKNQLYLRLPKTKQNKTKTEVDKILT